MSNLSYQPIYGKFRVKAPSLPDDFLSISNIEHLLGLERLSAGLAVTFARNLNKVLHLAYSDIDILSMYNIEPHDLRPVGINLRRERGGRISFEIHEFKETEFVGKFPEIKKLIVSLFEESPVFTGVWVLREITLAPLLACFASVHGLSNGHMVYAHTFTTKDSIFGLKGIEPSYAGITKHSWARRWGQHIAAARSGSPYRFHEAIRRFHDSNPVTHEVVACGATFEEAMRIEEWMVDTHSFHPKGFNMIPGGFAGIRYLAGKGFPVINRDWEYRERTLNRISKESVLKGRPNPIASALWRDDDYATSVICASPKNYDLKTVRQIRAWSEIGKTPEEISALVGGSVERVKKLLKGETYSRVA